MTTSSGGETYGTPQYTVSGNATASFVVGALSDNTTYYFVVRSSNGTLEDDNTVEISATTVAFPTLPSTVPAATLYSQLASYWSFLPSGISVGEITTVAGLWNAPWYMGQTVTNVTRMYQMVSPEGVAIDSSGNIYVSDQNTFDTRLGSFF